MERSYLKLKIVMVLMSLALLGLIAIQFDWLYKAWQLQKQEFRRQVYMGINHAVLQIQKKEAERCLHFEKCQQQGCLQALRSRQPDSAAALLSAEKFTPRPNAKPDTKTAFLSPTETNSAAFSPSLMQPKKQDSVTLRSQSLPGLSSETPKALPPKLPQTYISVGQEKEKCKIIIEIPKNRKKLENFLFLANPDSGKQAFNLFSQKSIDRLALEPRSLRLWISAPQLDSVLLERTLSRAEKIISLSSPQFSYIQISHKENEPNAGKGEILPPEKETSNVACCKPPVANNDESGRRRSAKALGLAVLRENRFSEKNAAPIASLSGYRPIASDSAALDSILRKTLHNHGISQNFRFEILNRQASQSGSSALSCAANCNIPLGNPIQKKIVREDKETGAFTVQLFPDLKGEKSEIIRLSFPQNDKRLLLTLIPELSLALAFIAILGFAFFYYLRFIFRQKRLSEMKNDFINNMTHELNTPITTIGIVTGLIRQKQNDISQADLQRYAHIIEQENQRLAENVKRVLQIAELEKNPLLINIQTLDLSQLIIEAAENIRFCVEAAGGKLKLNLEAPAMLIQGDRMHLSNLLFNLLDNAIKYSEAPPLIEISTRKEGEYLQLWVKDNGIGIPKADLARIFDKFYRVPTGNRHDVKGFGLGLAYVKAIVEAHKGSISVESKIGKGSVFKINLPYSLEQLTPVKIGA
jgi:two-component system phosphate regulon sensor histidine kinase PhoR